MSKAPLPHFHFCGRYESLPPPQLKHVAAAPALPLPPAANAEGKQEALGAISAVAVDPFDGSIWILVRCAVSTCCGVTHSSERVLV